MEDGKGGYRKTRISKLSGVEIPKPLPAVRERKIGLFDTKPEDVQTITFTPDLSQSPIPEDCIL